MNQTRRRDGIMSEYDRKLSRGVAWEGRVGSTHFDAQFSLTCGNRASVLRRLSIATDLWDSRILDVPSLQAEALLSTTPY